jgi:N-acetylmuramoyl-L-alanine amidase
MIYLFGGALPAVGEPSARVGALRSEYFRLRNNDASGDAVAHQSSWAGLAARISSQVGAEGLSVDTAALRVLGAETYLRLYRGGRQPRALAAARDLLSPVISDSKLLPADLRAEGYLTLGDVATYAREFGQAREAYLKALGLSAAVAERAGQRLTGLSNGTFKRFLPSMDREVPRPIKGAAMRGAVRGGSKIVVIDPGHGGGDRGAVSPVGGEEKEITLDISRRVKAILESRYGLAVRMTRDDDRFVPLARRTAYANSRQGDVFVSLHVNASAGHDGAGFEAYYLDNTDDKASRALAERENGVVPGAGLDDVSFMLSDLIQSGKLEDSILLTRSIEGAIRSNVINRERDLRSLGVKRAPFFVLVGAHMPCSLVELFFVDNPIEGRKLRSEAFRSALASAIADGISSFMSKR